MSSNVFLADLNNEHVVKNEQYKKNMQSLDKLVLFRFTEDLLVVPRDSAWFGYFNGSTLQPMEDTQLFQVSSDLFCAGLHHDVCCSLSLWLVTHAGGLDWPEGAPRKWAADQGGRSWDAHALHPGLV